MTSTSFARIASVSGAKDAVQGLKELYSCESCQVLENLGSKGELGEGLCRRASLSWNFPLDSNGISFLITEVIQYCVYD